MHKVRVWDLPTRLFHWALFIAVVGLVTTGKIGGNAMVWHFRFGYCVFALLLFRIIWGLIGGRWSRFASFIHSPANVIAYLRGRGKPEHSIGHSPIGAGSVFALLGFLGAQVATGLLSDDEIAFSGPLTKFVSGAVVNQATWYHKAVGQWVIITLVVVHIIAVLFYLWGKRHNLITPMVVGDKHLDAPALASRDDAVSRGVAALVMVLCGAGVAWVVSLGS